jgi:hypothetical protein
MPVPCHFDNLLLDRRCVAAYFHGTLPELHREVHLVAGCQQITLADLTSRAEVYTDAWRIGDPDKGNCYLCDSAVAPGTLCKCYDAIMAKRHVNVNEPRVLQKLHPETVVETFICCDCGTIASTIAKEALAQHKRGKGYQTRKFCSPCHKVHRGNKPQHAPKAPQPSLVQQAAESVVSGQA